ncbi:Uncharacterized protein DAT39_004568, partial [Clarias magur]
AQNQLDSEVFHTENQAKFKACSRSDGGTENCAMTAGNCWTMLVCDILDREGVCDLSGFGSALTAGSKADSCREHGLEEHTQSYFKWGL